MRTPNQSNPKPCKKYPPTYPPTAAKRPRHRPRAVDVHPGVVLVKPDDHGHPWWRVRYRDVATGRTVKRRLTPAESATAPSRLAAAVALAETLAAQRRDRELGRKLPTNVTLNDAFDRWLAAGRVEWSPGTLHLYRLAVGNLIRHLGGELYCREVTTEALALFRAAAASAGVRPRGKRSTNRRGDPRVKCSINHELRICKAFLRWARVGAGLALSTDDIVAALKPFREAHERKHFYEPHALQRLIKLARAHEAPCYRAIVCLLLTGMRMREFLRLDWSWVDEGDRLRVPASAAKGARYRDADLSVTKHALPPRPAGVHSGRIFPDVTAAELRAAFTRLRTMDPALAGLCAHALRRTCSTYFTCAYNPWRSAKSLGHTVTVAEKHYAGLVRVAPGVTLLEDAMGITDLLTAAAPKPLRNRRNTRKDYKGVAA